MVFQIGKCLPADDGRTTEPPDDQRVSGTHLDGDTDAHEQQVGGGEAEEEGVGDVLHAPVASHHHDHQQVADHAQGQGQAVHQGHGDEFTEGQRVVGDVVVVVIIAVAVARPVRGASVERGPL